MHMLVVDTNVLWLRDKGPIVNPEFDTFWKDHKELLRMELIVPEVVRDELIFQHYASGKKVIEKVTEHMSEFSSITAKKHRHRLSEEALKKLVREKFDKWVASKDGKIAEVPIGTIDLRKLYDMAIWRIPPFEFDAKNAENEKGFRDALIYETVVDLAKKQQREVTIAFVSNDKLLRNAIDYELLFTHDFLAFEGLADFSSYIKLTREQLTKEFIEKIVKRAGGKFHTANDPNCLWIKEKIGERLFEMKDAWRIDSVSTLSTATHANALASRSQTTEYAPVMPHRSWKPTALNKYFLGPHEFVETSGTRTYHWSSTVTAVAKYILGDGQVATEERIRRIDFKVLWKADVKADARFHNIALEDVKVENTQFKTPTPEEFQRFDLDQYSTPEGG